MPRYTYQALTPAQLSEGLNETGLTVRQFCRITGSDPRRVERWLTGEQPNPPLWVGMILTALTVQEARRRMLRYADLAVRDTRHES